MMNGTQKPKKKKKAATSMGSYTISRFDSPNRRKKSIGENNQQESDFDHT
jgi:hypothetical protein